MEVRSLDERHRLWAASLVSDHFGSTRIVSRCHLHETLTLPCLVAVLDDAPAGLLHYRLDGDECEVVTLIAARPRCGVGTSLLDALGALAQDAGCRRLWLVTTNDNRSAQRFYRELGWRKSAVYPGAARAARALKPEIPLHGEDGIPIEDEIEYELSLVRT